MQSLNEDGGVLKQVIRAGEGPKVTNGSSVTLHFIGTFDNGSVFDDTYKKGSPLVVKAGNEQTIPGLDVALLTMNEGEKALIKVTAKYGYGAHDNPHGFHGCGTLIPGNSTLTFDLELMDVDDTKGTDPLVVATNLKTQGNASYKNENFFRAVVKYNKALSTLPSIENPTKEQEKEIGELTSACNLNIAACLLQTKDYRGVIECCKKVLELDKNNVKALFRLGKAQAALNEDNPLETLLKAAKIQNSKEIQDEIKAVKQQLAKQENKDKRVYSQMFSKLKGEGHLYEGVEPAKNKKKCNICGEEVDEVQYARHVIKKHSDKKS